MALIWVIAHQLRMCAVRLVRVILIARLIMAAPATAAETRWAHARIMAVIPVQGQSRAHAHIGIPMNQLAIA